jgi:hypothetical protein
MRGGAARPIGPVSIWPATAPVVVFGVFRADWGGSGPSPIVVALLARAAATPSTGFVWHDGRPSAQRGFPVVQRPGDESPSAT